MELHAALEVAADCACLLGGSAGIVAALRYRARATTDRIAARLAVEREAAVLSAARRASDASRASVAAVREVLCHAVETIAPCADLFLVYETGDDGVVRCVDAHGARAGYYAGAELGALSPLVAAAVRGHHAVIGEGGMLAPLHPGDRAGVVVPLDDAPETVAFAYIASVSAELIPLVPLVAAIADQAAPAYRLAREREADRRRAEYDGLTGLLAPKAFRARLARTMEHALLDPRARIALLFIDTDRFKAWNDTYGHASGDALLRAIAGCIRASAHHGGDIVARNGGDEFCAVFTETEKSQAIERAEELRRAIGALDLDRLTPDGAAATVHVTASIGIATYPYDAKTADELLELADAAMYRSKHDGRDRVTFCDVDGTLRGAAREAAAAEGYPL